MEVAQIKSVMQTKPDSEPTKKVATLKKSKSVEKRKVKVVKSQTGKIRKRKSEKSLLRKSSSKISKSTKKGLKPKKIAGYSKLSLTKKPLKRTKNTLKTKVKSADASKIKLKTKTASSETGKDEINKNVTETPNIAEKTTDAIKPSINVFNVNEMESNAKKVTLSKPVAEVEILAAQSKTKSLEKSSLKFAKDQKPTTSKKIWKF